MTGTFGGAIHGGDDAADVVFRGQTVADWMEERLRAERVHLEGRHRALCDALRSDFAAQRGPSPVLTSTKSFVALQPREAVKCELAVAAETVEPPRLAAGQELTECEPNSDASFRSQDLQATTPRTRRASEKLARPLKGIGQKVADSAQLKLAKEAATARMPNKKEPIHRLRTAETELMEGTSCLHKFVVGSRFELIFAALIVSNAVVMALEAQHDGDKLGHAIAFAADPPVVWAGAKAFFHTLEFIFGALFTVEVVLKLCVLRTGFPGFWNLFDFFIVSLWVIYEIVGDAMRLNPTVLRLCRLLRLIRLVRLVRVIEFFDTLVLMVSSIQASYSILVWGTTLLVVIMSMVTLSLYNALLGFMLDEQEADEDRHEVYKYFGSFTRGMITMFEITLGNWVPVCRLLHDKVNQWFGLFFLVYKLVVGFAVVKVITGVFLHETFRCASMNDELMIQTRERATQKFSQKMMRFFKEADISGDGYVSLEEFVEIMKDARVRSWLQAMDFNVLDPERVFSYLAGNEEFQTAHLTKGHRLTADQLVKGVARLRGTAQEIDLLTLMAHSHEHSRDFEARSDENGRLRQLMSDVQDVMQSIHNMVEAQHATAAHWAAAAIPPETEPGKHAAAARTRSVHPRQMPLSARQPPSRCSGVAAAPPPDPPLCKGDGGKAIVWLEFESAV